MSVIPRFNIEPVPLVKLYVATDAQRRLRLSVDMIRNFDLNAGNRVLLGFDAAAQAIAIRITESATNPEAATVDQRGYISARRFYTKTQIAAEFRRFAFVAEQDGWLVFTAE